MIKVNKLFRGAFFKEKKNKEKKKYNLSCTGTFTKLKKEIQLQGKLCFRFPKFVAPVFNWMRRRSLKDKTNIDCLFPLHAFLSLIFFFSTEKTINNIGKKLVSTLLAKATQKDGRNIDYTKNTKPLQCEHFVPNT